MRVVEANDLFVSHVEGESLSEYTQSTAIGRGRAVTGWAWGADFFDVDNDGDDDLYVGNGMNEFAVYSTENAYYTDPKGVKRDVLFPRGTREANVLFINENGKLNHAGEQSGADLLGNSRAVVYVDYDLDGDLDMILNNYHERAVVYKNNAEKLDYNWIGVRLIGDPKRGSSRDAIGATLYLDTPDGNTVWREVHGGSGYLTMHPKEQHFGLGNNATGTLRVRWPNGQEDVFDDLAAGRRYLVMQAERGTIETVEYSQRN
jgi:hypothetical protein